MSFQRYPEYKQPNTPWIDAVPKSWDVIQAKRGISVLTDFTANGSFASLAENVEYRSAGYARLIRMTDLRHRLVKEGVWVDEDAYRYLKKSALHGGELLMASVGSVGLVYQMPEVDYPATLAPNMYLLKTNKLLYERYFNWLLLSSIGQDQISQSATTTAQPKLNKDNVRSLILPLPSEAEQFKISAFLDHETTRIDALVEEQKRLIELLKEKRQAVISHAVTKGLDPDVPMKDSGVEWLGEVPSHWGIRKASYIGRLFGSDNIPEDMVSEEGDVPYLKVGSLSVGSLEVGDWGWYVSSSFSSKCRATNHYVVFPKRGAAIFLNKVNVVTRPALIDPNLMGWKIDGRHSTWYFAYTLKLRKLDELADVSTVPQINNKHIGPEIFPLPPIEEQEEIVSHLTQRLSKIDELIDSACSGINLFEERRSALISAAVTGKIDVRNWQPSQATEQPELPMVAEARATYR